MPQLIRKLALYLLGRPPLNGGANVRPKRAVSNSMLFTAGLSAVRERARRLTDGDFEWNHSVELPLQRGLRWRALLWIPDTG